MLVDSHCHLDRLDLTPYDGDLGAALQAAHAAGVTRMLCIGIDRGNAETVCQIARAHEGVYASVGIHPCDIADEVETAETLIALADRPEVIALGETGLDYHYSRERAAEQQASFRAHLRASKTLRKPVVVHTREAREDTLAILREEVDPAVAGVLHCFTETWEMAEAALELGFYVSFSGIITFRNAEPLREVVRRMPLDRLLVETDAPFLAPVPHRGKKNEPRFTREVAACVAELKGLSLEEVAEVTSANFDRLFRVA
ncbi:MAG: TatD family hydrolase [Spongiibacteraceae bacterium]|jgi:TatD DNase family protein|nr:TatD family hydrolase [Spongiibacteraceae bacterium]